MADNSSKGTPYEHFSRAWHILLPLSLGLFWLGHNVVGPDQVDDRVSSGIKPLQDRTEWIEEEIRRHERQPGHRGTVEALKDLEQRIRVLEGR